jgi:hypothetical protein
MREIFGRMVMDSLKEDRDAFTNYSALAYYDENLTYVVGILVFVANIKFLKLLRFNKHVRSFITTLKLCRKALMYFFITLLILMMGFSTWAYISFGTNLYGFSSFWLVVETLFSYMLGKMDHIRELGVADRYLGQPFFILYVFLIFFISMNMFVGIIGFAYAQVIAMEDDADHSDVMVIDFILQRLRKLVGIKEEQKPEYVEADDPFDVLAARIDSFDHVITNIYLESIKKSKPEKPTSDSVTLNETTNTKTTFKNLFKKKSRSGSVDEGAIEDGTYTKLQMKSTTHR